MEVYKLNIYHHSEDNYDREVSPFLNSDPMYIIVPNTEFIMQIYKLIKIAILNCSIDYNHEYKFKYYKNTNNYMYDCQEEITIDSKNIIEFLSTHNELSILEFESGKYWSKIYIQLVKTSSKAHYYTLDEINDYIEKKF